MPLTPQLPPDNIALINVPYGSTSGPSMRPLGLSYLGAFLRSHDVAVRGFDLSDSRLSAETIVERHGLASFDVVGLSYYNQNARTAYRMSEAIKARNPRCVIVVGGPHATAAHATLLPRQPALDVVVRNEGEETFLETITAIGSGAALDGIAGVTFRSNGGIRSEHDRDRLDDLDSLPAPVFDFERHGDERPLRYFDRTSGALKPAVALVTSRSCPYSCSFCAIILIGRQWRKASAAKVVSDLHEIETQGKTEFGHVYFMDANFFVSAPRALEVAEALHRYRPGITFSFSTRVNQLIKGKRLLPELKRLGLRAVELGIESGSAAALGRFAKDTSPEQNDEAVRLLECNGLQLFLDFIMFDAEATLDDIEANLDFFERNGLDSYVPWDHIFSYMTPYLGTEIRRHYEELIGSSFDEDALPDPSSLFQSHDVKAVFDQANKLRSALPKLTEALFKTEGRVRDFRSWGREEAREKLNAATMRRLPFVVLRNLLMQARRSEAVSYGQAFPKFYDELGEEVDIDLFLRHQCGDISTYVDMQNSSAAHPLI
jgi:radical SAM superfamily enzyme YgiQ (UPF0313 family)